MLNVAPFALAVAALAGAARLWHRAGAVEHQRGALVYRRARRGGRLAPWALKSRLTLGGVYIAPLDECKHFKLIGTTGTGKSTAIAELLAGALERGDRAVISDPDGGYLQRFLDRQRGDVVLNPFEPDSACWDPFAEIHASHDVEQLAIGLIPPTEDPSGREWRGYARTLLTAILRRCHERERCDASELWRLLAVASTRELRVLVAGTPAQPFLEAENLRMLGSIRSVASSAAAALELVQKQRGRGFSVRHWVRQGRGILFLPYRAGQIAALRSIIATWLRIAIFEAMAHAEADLRLWFVMDELDALGAIDGLKDALARLRKFGGRCVLGFQSMAQVSGTYGAADAQTITENCGNTLILRCSGSEAGGTAQYASRLIGEREVERRQTTRGQDTEGLLGVLGGRGGRRSRTVSPQRITELAVMASELEQLPDLTGYLKRASADHWQRVMLAR